MIFQNKGSKTGQRTQNQANPSEIQERSPRKITLITHPLYTAEFAKDRTRQILSSKFESSQSIGFESDDYKEIVDNSAIAHICSYEDILTDKIDNIIINGVSTIGGKILFQ